jgi:pilus assembly protein Flp/PilA
MKFNLRFVLFFSIVSVLILTASTPLPVIHADNPPAEIGAEQAVLLGLIASGLVFALNIFAKSNNKKISRNWLTVIVYGLSVVFAFMWSSPALPAFPSGSDPSTVSQAYAAFAMELLKQGSIILGFSTLIYNWLLKRIDENIKYPPETIGPDMGANAGQGMVEYALILVLVAVVVIAAVTIMGPLIGQVFSTINSSL